MEYTFIKSGDSQVQVQHHHLQIRVQDKVINTKGPLHQHHLTLMRD